MHKSIGALLFLYHLGAPTQNLPEICGFTEERGSEEGLKTMLPFQQNQICEMLLKPLYLVASNCMGSFFMIMLQFL